MSSASDQHKAKPGSSASAPTEPNGTDAVEAAGAVEVTEAEPRSRMPIILALLLVLALVAGWIFVLFIYRPSHQLDELSDTRFPKAAEKICAVTMAQLDDLPPASQAASAAARSKVVTQADALLGGMVAQLDSIAPTGSEKASAGVREWVADWRNHIGDRDQYAEALRTNSDARFLESTKGTRQLSRAIDGFAEVNKMKSCSTPGDVG